MERLEAVTKLQQLKGQDLRELADNFGITVFKDNKKNKGWAGQVVERYLGLPLNSSQSPNFGSWELKTISLKRLRNDTLTVKETMAITMIDPINVVNTDFENSHLLMKMKKILILSRIWEDKSEPSSIVYGIHTFDIGDTEIYNQVKNDYELVRDTIINLGFEALTGKMGVFVQPRTKGAGHGSTSRAFYARVTFLKKLIFRND
uniref:DNA mismatch repair MutH/Type II restriction enzyme Sau3AI domain-containing protein n=1 Tax=Ignavibacterium album TaxID=591197 RepID=A0A7V3E5Q4_9BACT